MKTLTIVKLTKGGMAHLQYENKFYTVPPNNVDLVEEDERYLRKKISWQSEFLIHSKTNTKTN